jgi:glycogen debranching enzyme
MRQTEFLALSLSFFILSSPSLRAQTPTFTQQLTQAIVVLPHDNASSSVVTAGPHQFRSLWARDFAFSVPGLLKMHKFKAVQNTLEVFFANIRAKDGLLPRLMDSRPFQSRVVLGLAGLQLPLDWPLQPSFETENGVISIDGNLLLVVAAWQYIQRTHDHDFSQKYLRSARRALAWIQRNHTQNGLMIRQPPYSDWADSVQRSGSVGFTQLLYLRALRALGQWESSVGASSLSHQYWEQFSQAQAALMKYYWDEAGYLKNTTEDARLSADVNWGAVAWNLVTKDKSRQILATLAKSAELTKPLPGRVLEGEYDSSEKSIFVKIAGISGYHDSFYWLWITALSIQAYDVMGDHRTADIIRAQLGEVMKSSGGVHEVYWLANNQLVPVRTFGYRAEFPFTWSLAMVAFVSRPSRVLPGMDLAH